MSDSPDQRSPVGNHLPPMTLCQTTFDFSRPYLMGVLNATPDSFSDGGHFFDPAKAMTRIEQMIRDGADIIDIGAESTRPGSDPVPVAEEIRRLKPLLTAYASHFSTPVSVDTRKSEVAEFALSLGVHLINDISGLKDDPRMASVVATYNAGLIVMHMQGSPKTMQIRPVYGDVVTEVRTHLKHSLDVAVSAGIKHIILDPGIGFGKTVSDNLRLIKNIHEFCRLGRPILIGTSRKSFIKSIVGGEPSDRLEGTLASNLLAVMNGANVVRVHDVRAVKKMLKVAAAIWDA